MISSDDKSKQDPASKPREIKQRKINVKTVRSKINISKSFCTSKGLVVPPTTQKLLISQRSQRSEAVNQTDQKVLPITLIGQSDSLNNSKQKSTTKRLRNFRMQTAVNDNNTAGLDETQESVTQRSPTKLHPKLLQSRGITMQGTSSSFSQMIAPIRSSFSSSKTKPVMIEYSEFEKLK